jgi:hypothetical protein
MRFQAKSSASSTDREGGFALFAVLGFVALIATVASISGTQSRYGVAEVGIVVERGIMKTAAEGVLAMAAVKAGGERKALLQDFCFEPSVAEVQITLIPASALIDLNNASESLLMEAAELAGLGQSTWLAERIQAARAADSINSVDWLSTLLSREDYRLLGPMFTVASRSIGLRIDEAALVNPVLAKLSLMHNAPPGQRAVEAEVRLISHSGTVLRLSAEIVFDLDGRIKIGKKKIFRAFERVPIIFTENISCK